MIIDGQERGGTYQADVCVIGTGAAGLTLADSLLQQGVSVVLVESGGNKLEPHAHALLEVEQEGMAAPNLLTFTRERFFGGTTNHWGGVCRTLGPFEFQRHSWVPHSGWPISEVTLAEYYRRAAALLNLPEADRPYNPKELGVADKPPLVKEDEKHIETRVWWRVPNEKRRFGAWHLDTIRNNPLCTCLLNTTIARLEPSKAGDRIMQASGRSYNGNTMVFRAKDFVLCTGAIENPRLLLASDSENPKGVGNEHDLVGRFFMDHPSQAMGRYLPAEPKVKRSREESLLGSNLVGWTTTDEFRRENELLGFQALFYDDQSKSVLPHERAMQSLIGSPIAHAERARGTPRQTVLGTWEQSPNPSSRIMLSRERDQLGVPKAKLDWNYSKLDLESARKSAEALSIAIAKSGLGRLFLHDFTVSPLQSFGGHQMGTTRMADDPREGVTDANGRVHSVENLFVGGSSLFPTGGWQHPTLTIVALSLRMADHIASRHSST